jgi:large subunit ribosomal protein L15
MNLNELTKIKIKRAKRIGRGPGSGRGKTAGYGQKGQNVRGGIPLTHPHYEGGQRPLFKRLPLRRGKGSRRLSKKPLIVKLGILNLLPKNSHVDLDLLIKEKIVDKNDAETFGVKILGNGNIENPLGISLPISKSAAARIEKAGGKVLYQKLKSEVESGTASKNSSKPGSPEPVEKPAQQVSHTKRKEAAGQNRAPKNRKISGAEKP